MAQGRLGHVQDVLIVALSNAVGNRDPGLRGLMRDTQLICCCYQFTRIIGVNLLDLAPPAKPFEGLAGFAWLFGWSRAILCKNVCLIFLKK